MTATMPVAPSLPSARRPTNRDVYEKVTARIVAALESGVIPWQRPWNSPRIGPPANAITGRRYHGGNVLSLLCEAWSRGYTSSHFLTFHQARTYGVTVRRGEKGAPVYYVNKVLKRRSVAEVLTSGDDDETPSVLVARLYYVFNLDALADLEESPGRLEELRAKCGLVDRAPDWDPVAECEQIVARLGVDVREGTRAAYNPVEDYVAMPPRHSFPNGAESYYPVLFHELTHWTAPRLQRNQERGPFGTPAYAFEELVAELGAAFLSSRAGFDHVTQAASYLDNWLSLLREQPGALISASRLAQDAADFVWPMPDDTPDPDNPEGEL